MKIGFDFEATEPEPAEECSRCHKIITGKKYVPFIQVGQITDTQTLNVNWCEQCMIETGFEVNKEDNTPAL